MLNLSLCLPRPLSDTHRHKLTHTHTSFCSWHAKSCRKHKGSSFFFQILGQKQQNAITWDKSADIWRCVWHSDRVLSCSWNEHKRQTERKKDPYTDKEISSTDSSLSANFWPSDPLILSLLFPSPSFFPPPSNPNFIPIFDPSVFFFNPHLLLNHHHLQAAASFCILISIAYITCPTLPLVLPPPLSFLLTCDLFHLLPPPLYFSLHLSSLLFSLWTLFACSLTMFVD